MAPGYPLLVDLTDRRAVVVGGGPVAARRARSLADAGARVEVVAPWADEELWAMQDAGRVRLVLREYEHGDLAGCWIVHTATGEPAVDLRVAEDAEAANVWCVRADDASRAAAWTPASVTSGDVVLAVNAGGDPRRAVAIRDAVRLLLDTGELPVRRRRAAQPGGGRVALVGGGPGDPGLITVRGRRLLAEADVVVVDRLAPRALLDELDPDVEVVEAGKSPGSHSMTQDEINAALVSHAKAGKRVVRLKGGDPYVLGRGGEEALACIEAGVPWEVVPGVTSALGAPAAAGIPVTHRGLVRGFTVLSGHDEEIDWTTAGGEDVTLVLLMAVGRLAAAAEALMAHGRKAETPVAVVERGTLPEQRTTVATLGTLAAVAAERRVQSPAVVVVGSVVGLADELGRQR